MKLLLIEDDAQMAQTVREELLGDYLVELAGSAKKALELIDSNDYDLLILDLNLPDMSGLKLCQKLRDEHIRTPILILTAEDSVRLKVELLDSGADDYLTKPFKMVELKARIRALLRRPPSSSENNLLKIDDLTLDLERKLARRGEDDIFLRRKEFDLLEYLIRNAGKVLTRNMILEHVWESDYDSLGNTVDVHVKHLRDRVDRGFGKKLIKTVHGLGYKIEA